MENKAYFRGAIVGGYNKEDVHRCIQELKKVTEEELQTNEEIVSELNVQMEEQKNEFETMLDEQKKSSASQLEEQKKRYEDMLAEQREKYEKLLAEQREKYEKLLEEQKEEKEAEAKVLKAESKVLEMETKVLEVESNAEELKNQCDILKEKYEASLEANMTMKEELKEFDERKNIIFRYEMDARARAEQLIVEAEDKAIAMVQDSKGRIDTSMKKYVALCDEYREQIHGNALAALKLQKQLEDAVLQVVESNQIIKLKVSELYNNTEKGIEMFSEDEYEID